MSTSSSTTYTIEDIEALARIQIPDSVANLESYVDPGGIDHLIALRIDLPADELDSFLEGAGYAKPLEPISFVPSLFGQMGSYMTNWPTIETWDSMMQEKADQLFSLQKIEPGFARNIIVDKSDPERYVIYLIHHSL